MRRLVYLAVCVVGMSVCAGPEPADSHAARVERARQASMTLGQTLKEHLLAAVQAGNFTGALEVCQAEAPLVAAAISERMGLKVSRTSTRVRNADNRADRWERAGLQALEKRIAAGENPATVELHEVVEGEFRYLKAIVTEPLCLTCHGREIDDILRGEIRSRYPGDRATGYDLGQLRGAFTVRFPAE